VRVVCVNTGSSSVKLRLLGADDAILGEHETDAPGSDVDAEALERAIGDLGDADAVVHRVVHGGERGAAARVDAALLEELRALTPLAPLHQPKALAAVAAAARARPQLPVVACFDTAFHAGLPPEAATYALPAEWRERFGLRQAMVDERLRLRRYTRDHGDDAPEVRDWTLPDRPPTAEEPARGHQA